MDNEKAAFLLGQIQEIIAGYNAGLIPADTARGRIKEIATSDTLWI